MIRPKIEERETKKPNLEKKDEAEVVQAKVQNHHSIDAILGRKQMKRLNQKCETPKEASDDEEDQVSDAELSSSEAKSGSS